MMHPVEQKDAIRHACNLLFLNYRNMYQSNRSTHLQLTTRYLKGQLIDKEDIG